MEQRIRLVRETRQEERKEQGRARRRTLQERRAGRGAAGGAPRSRSAWEVGLHGLVMASLVGLWLALFATSLQAAGSEAAIDSRASAAASR